MKSNELLDLLIEAERHMTETNSMLRGRRLSTLAHLIELDGIDQESYNKKAEVISEENKMDIDLLNRIRAAIKQHQEDEFTGVKSAGGRYVDCFDELKSIYEEMSKDEINHETNNLTQKQDEKDI